MKVTTYLLRAANGHRIRQATKVLFPDGREVKFMDRLPKGQAIQQARRVLHLCPDCGMTANVMGRCPAGHVR